VQHQAYMNQRKLNEAIEYYEKSLEIHLKIAGKDHPDTANSKNNIGLAYQQLI
jgi:tetratricopeptide (TPR) repeat protein